MSTARLMLAPAVASPDEGLIAAARDGDHAAYTALYQRHAGRVYARLTQLVGPTGDREDLLQQVFLELYRALPRFRADSSIGTFIQGIAVHVALDHLRRRRRRPQDFTAAELDELIDGSSPRGAPRRRERRARLPRSPRSPPAARRADRARGSPAWDPRRSSDRQRTTGALSFVRSAAARFRGVAQMLRRDRSRRATGAGRYSEGWT
jgi:RNA polymerase sigma factor (sigma-70 family)